MRYGFLRETSEKAKIAGLDKETKLPRTGLDEYLKVIFPNITDWIHNEVLPNTKRRCRPDYRSESLKLIVEFDGLPHYQNPDIILSDKEHTNFYKSLGYTVIRIPFFIQLTKGIVKKLFNVDIKEQLFPINIHSFTIKDKATPAYMCYEGMKRAAKELIEIADEEQFNTNMQYLKRVENDNLSCYKLFSDIIKNLAIK